MKSKITFKKIITGIVASAMIFSASPQLPMKNNVSIAEAAQVKLSTKKVTLKKGQSKQIKLKNAVGKVTWKSKNKNVATVAKGLIRAKKAGNTTVVATYNNRQFKCTVSVTEPVSKPSNNSGENESAEQTATVYWAPSGEVYHKSRSCPTLSRSRTVYSGSISSSGKSRGCKVCY